MEDYFVIILTLVIAVIGALRGKKKKNAPAPTTSEESNKPSNLWEVIMNDQEDEQMSPYAESAPGFVEPELVQEEKKEPVLKREYKFTAGNEGESEIEEEIKKVVKPKKQILIEGEKFSLRKAVIYSEIMNRKYS